MSFPSLLYMLVALIFAAFIFLMPGRRLRRPPAPGNDDDSGGEPLGDGLPDFDLPPGISRPINDWEPDYNRRPVIRN